uniref:Uncharacterized protein n=1 Tax=Anguilla anguilla TaxID=7936 RepID=A0A0E9VEM3_ANGAN
MVTHLTKCRREGRAVSHVRIAVMRTCKEQQIGPKISTGHVSSKCRIIITRKNSSLPYSRKQKFLGSKHVILLIYSQLHNIWDIYFS